MVMLHLSLLELAGSSSTTLHTPIPSPLVNHHHMPLTMSPLDSPFPFRSESTPQVGSPTGSTILILDEASIRIHDRSGSFSLLATSLSISGNSLCALRDRPSDLDDDTDFEALALLKFSVPLVQPKGTSRLACDDAKSGDLVRPHLKLAHSPHVDPASNAALYFPHFFSKPARNTSDGVEASYVVPNPGPPNVSDKADVSGGPRHKKIHSLSETKAVPRHQKLLRRAQPQRLASIKPDAPHLKFEVASRFPAHDPDHAIKSLLEQHRLISQMNHRWNSAMNGFLMSPRRGPFPREETHRHHKRARSDSTGSRTDTDDNDQDYFSLHHKDAN